MSDHDDDRLLDELGRALTPPVPPVDPARVARVTELASDVPVPAAAGPSRRSVLWMGAAAAGGLAAGVTGAVLLTDDDAPVGPPTEEVASITASEGVGARAELIDHTWGLEVMLDVSGLDPGTPYLMTFVDRAGGRAAAGGFVGTDGLMRCRNNGAVLRADVARFEVADPDGAVVVSGDLA